MTGDNRITAAEQAAGLTLTGSAEAGGKVGVVLHAHGYTSLSPVDETGRWPVTLTSMEVLNGSGTLTLYHWDKAGNEVTQGYRVQMDATEPGTLIALWSAW